MKPEEAFVLQEQTAVVNSDGIGNTPTNHDIDYFGIRVLMTPLNFLKLAAKTGSNPRMESVEYLVNAILSGEAVAPPFLKLEVPHSWTGDSDDGMEVAKVVGHEGRHRMLALSRVYGRNYPIEVHITFYGYRNRHVTREWIESLIYDGIEEEDSKRVVKRSFVMM